MRATLISVQRVSPAEVKCYLLFLIDEERCGWSKYRQIVCALRFLYPKVLGHEWMAEHIPFPRRGRTLPQFLTSDEVRQVLSVVENQKHRMILELIFATGLRTAEACKLKIEDPRIIWSILPRIESSIIKDFELISYILTSTQAARGQNTGALSALRPPLQSLGEGRNANLNS